MKLRLVSILMFGAAATLAAQQVPAVAPPSGAERAALEGQVQAAVAGGGARATLSIETRVTTGAPYSAEAITEFTHTLADGNRISRKSVTRSFRDSEGRTRRETVRQTAAGESVSIAISDPVARVSWLLDPETRTASRTATVMARPTAVPPVMSGGRGGGGGGGRGGALPPAPATTPPVLPEGHVEVRRVEAERTAVVDQAANSRDAAAASKISLERAASGNATSTKESLGSQVMEGVMAEGTRTTTVIPAGGVGNAQPITIVSEQWYSPDLQVFVQTRHSDPRSGETVYRLANIVRGEPDRSLFEVPADYTVKSRGGVMAPIRPPQ